MNATPPIRMTVLLPILLALGCTNTPGALVLHLRCEKQVFARGEPVRLYATLEATGGTVCLAKEWTTFSGVLTGGETPRQRRNTPKPAFCGTGIAVLLPIAPLVFPVLLLDVGDGLGRFTIIPKTDAKRYHLEMIPASSRIALITVEDARKAAARADEVPLPPGRYHLKVTFLHRGSLPPLLWNPYSHPLVAETEFEVAASAERNDDAQVPRPVGLGASSSPMMPRSRSVRKTRAASDSDPREAREPPSTFLSLPACWTPRRLVTMGLKK